MSKMTKVIAALGVVAGLGVAALPLSSYAATGSVGVKVAVDSSISLSTSTNTIDLGTMTTKDTRVETVSITVNADSENGYKLTAQGTELMSSDGKTIEGIDGSEKDDLSEGGWAIGTTDSGSTIWENPLSLVTLKSNGKGKTDDLTTMYVGVNADGAEAGTYTSTITLTATVNAGA